MVLIKVTQVKRSWACPGHYLPFPLGDQLCWVLVYDRGQGCDCTSFLGIYIMHSFNSSPHSAAYMSVYWVSIGSGNGLSPVLRQAITWTNAGLLSIELLGKKFCEIRIGILLFSFKKMLLKLSSAMMAAILSRGEMRKPNQLLAALPFCKWHN